MARGGAAATARQVADARGRPRRLKRATSRGTAPPHENQNLLGEDGRAGGRTKLRSRPRESCVQARGSGSTRERARGAWDRTSEGRQRRAAGWVIRGSLGLSLQRPPTSWRGAKSTAIVCRCWAHVPTLGKLVGNCRAFLDLAEFAKATSKTRGESASRQICHNRPPQCRRHHKHEVEKSMARTPRTSPPAGAEMASRSQSRCQHPRPA